MIFVVVFVFFFFFKQKTAYEMRISDWSSDVCSSDLIARLDDHGRRDGQSLPIIGTRAQAAGAVRIVGDVDAAREHPAAEAIEQIGRASCRERVCQYV